MSLGCAPWFFPGHVAHILVPSCSHKHRACSPRLVCLVPRLLSSHFTRIVSCAASGHVTRRAGVVRMVRVKMFRMMATVLFHAIAMLLAALGNSRDDALVLNVVWVVGLNVGSQAVECPLKRIFGGRVHHTWLLQGRVSNSSERKAKSRSWMRHTYCGASSGTHEMKVILLLLPSWPSKSYSTSNTA